MNRKDRKRLRAIVGNKDYMLLMFRAVFEGCLYAPGLLLEFLSGIGDLLDSTAFRYEKWISRAMPLMSRRLTKVLNDALREMLAEDAGKESL